MAEPQSHQLGEGRSGLIPCLLDGVCLTMSACQGWGKPSLLPELPGVRLGVGSLARKTTARGPRAHALPLCFVVQRNVRAPELGEH